MISASHSLSGSAKRSNNKIIYSLLIGLKEVMDFSFDSANIEEDINLNVLELLGSDDLYVELIDQKHLVDVKIFNNKGLRNELSIEYSQMDLSYRLLLIRSGI